jgi:crotonobetainyl-CoA:carnitine CoA-transferase CaiB-like acyl-CoA transferase
VSQEQTAVTGVLSGVRVLDFGRYIAGPYCAALLAEFGAEVIRIEKRGGGEDRTVAPVAQGGEGAIFLQMNRNKRGMTLDPMTAGGGEIMRRLIGTSDIVIANLPHNTLHAMGLDYATLSAIRADIILVLVTAFGRTGPYADRVGFDSVAQVMSGASYLTADDEGAKPYRYQAPWVDFSTALHCAYGALIALMSRQRTGKGQIVESALLADALTITNPTLIEQSLTKANRRPSGNRGQTAAPVDIFRTKDGWIMLQVIGQPIFKRWAALMGEPHWLCDERFADDRSRGLNAGIICERMTLWCAERTTAEALSQLSAARLPAAPVLSPQQVLDDPHVAQMDLFEDVDFPGLARPAPLARAPVWLSQDRGAIVRRAPLLGEHTDEIMRELGYSNQAIAAFRRDRAI